MKCNIPTFVKDYVSVISWLQEPAFNIYPATESGTYKSQSFIPMLSFFFVILQFPNFVLLLLLVLECLTQIAYCVYANICIWTMNSPNGCNQVEVYFHVTSTTELTIVGMPEDEPWTYEIFLFTFPCEIEAINIFCHFKFRNSLDNWFCGFLNYFFFFILCYSVFDWDRLGRLLFGK